MRTTRRYSCRAPLALVMLALLSIAISWCGALAAGTSSTSHSAPKPHVYSVRDTPGYKPLVDPESSAVALGRRVNAPLVRRPFKGGETSIDLLGRAVLRQLHRNKTDSLMTSYCVTDTEFKEILWPEFPQSRPVTGIQWDDAWRILWARLHAGMNHGVRDFGDHVYQFVSFKSDSVEKFKNFTLYHRMKLVAKDDEGKVREMLWIRTIVGRKGRFKVYSSED